MVEVLWFMGLQDKVYKVQYSVNKLYIAESRVLRFLINIYGKPLSLLHGYRIFHIFPLKAIILIISYNTLTLLRDGY